AVRNGDGDGGRASLISRERDGHRPVRAAATKGDVRHRHETGVGGTAREREVGGRRLRVTDGEGDRAGGRVGRNRPVGDRRDGGRRVGRRHQVHGEHEGGAG